MQRFALFLTFLSFLVFTAHGCTSSLLPHIKNNPSGSPPTIPGFSAVHSKEAAVPKFIQTIDQFITPHRESILAILALLFLWIYARGYYSERKRKQIIRMSKEDLGLIKTIKVCSSMLWNRYNPRKNVVWLDDWRE